MGKRRKIKVKKDNPYYPRVYVPVAGLPSTEGGVRAIQDQVLNLVNSAQEPKYQFFIQKQVERLKALQAESLSMEEEFYHIFGVKSIDELQAKFNTLLNSGLNQLSNINLAPLITQIQERIGQAMDKMILDILNSPSLANRVAQDRKVLQDIYGLLGGIVQLELTQAFTTLKSRNTGFQFRQAQAGIFAPEDTGSHVILTIDNYLEIVQNEIKFRNGVTKLSPWMRQRLLVAISNMTGSPKIKVTNADLKEILQKVGIPELKYLFNVDLRNDISRIVAEHISNPEMAKLAVNEIEQNFAKYAIGGNSSVIKGFAGELQFNLLVKEVFRTSTPAGTDAIARFFATGNMIDTNGKSFGVDSVMRFMQSGVFRQFNFQVKNLKDLTNSNNEQIWEYEAGGSMKSIMSRAGIPSNGLLDQFYGSWSFNEPFDQDPWNRGWPGGYAGTYARFAQIASQMDNIFLSYADRIMRVDQIFMAKMDSANLFPMGQHINTFFMVNQRLIPSSRIIGGIIGAIQSANTSTLINFDILKISQENAKGTANLLSLILSQNPLGYSVNSNDYTANVDMRYKITINITQIMDQVGKI